MFGLVSQAVGYGFAAGTTPGPFIGYIVNTTLTQGWRRGIILIFAPLISDIPIILLMVFVLRELPPAIKGLIQIGGGLFVLWIAWGAWKQFRARASINGDGVTLTSNRTLIQGVLMNLLNPAPYIFWGSVTGPLLIRGLEHSALYAAAFLVAFYGTLVGMLAVWVIVFDRVRDLDQRVTRLVLLMTIIVLMALGSLLITQGVGSVR